MRTLAAVAAGVVAAVAAFAGSGAFASNQAAPPSCAIAFIDTEKVLFEHPGYKESMERLRAEKDLAQDALTKRDAELRKRVQDLDARFSPGTPSYEAERKRIDMDMAELKFDVKERADGLQKRSVQDLAAAYQSVRSEAERIARERGFSAVLDVRTDPIRVNERGQVIGMNELQAKLATRSVVWMREDVDLTAAVIEALKPAAIEPTKPKEEKK